MDRLTAYLDEIQQFIYDKYELKVSITCIYDLLNCKKWSRKKMQNQVLERNVTL